MIEQSQWPAAAVEFRPLASLTPYARNARTHSDAQVEQIAASMREWGWTNPVLVDEGGTIIAGHGRVLAAVKAGINAAPVMVARGWTEAQKQAYVIADNQLALNAGWDIGKLSVEVSDLQGLGFDISLLGFTDKALRQLTGSGGLTDPDEVPEAPAVPTARLGDVWLLGPHRLVCGDCTDESAVRAALGREKPNLMVTDPPYGVDYDPDWRNRVARRDGTPFGGRAIGKVNNDDRADWREAWALFPGAVAYVWHGALHGNEVAESLEVNGLMLRSQIIWSKTNFVVSRGDYHYRHEPCWYAVRKGKAGNWCGDRSQQTVWEIDHRKSETGHSTQKPVECMKRPIENNSNPGEHVYDPFCGSGTTIIAAEITGRVCHAIEIDPAYVDVAVKRWENFTGKTATLEGQNDEPQEIADASQAGQGKRARRNSQAQAG